MFFIAAEFGYDDDYDVEDDTLQKISYKQAMQILQQNMQQKMTSKLGKNKYFLDRTNGKVVKLNNSQGDVQKLTFFERGCWKPSIFFAQEFWEHYCDDMVDKLDEDMADYITKGMLACKKIKGHKRENYYLYKKTKTKNKIIVRETFRQNSYFIDNFAPCQDLVFVDIEVVDLVINKDDRVEKTDKNACMLLLGDKFAKADFDWMTMTCPQVFKNIKRCLCKT